MATKANGQIFRRKTIRGKQVIPSKIPVEIMADERGIIPTYAYPGDAGCDLCSAESHTVTIWPGERKLVSTGLRVAVPDGYEMQIRSRSGMTFTHGVVVANAPGTVDSKFRGEVKVILHNVSDKRFDVEPGMRVAQAVFAPVVQAQFMRVDSLDETRRGEGGFGSSGH